MNEKELLDLAIEVMDLNKTFSPILTGSLMLYVRGIDKRRDSHDIDILIGVHPIDFISDIIVPNGFYQCSPAYPESVKFKKNDIIIDFLYSEEFPENINGINCANVKLLLDAKYNYYLNDENLGSREKHRLDLEYLNYIFPVIQPFDISCLF